jgi:hypothetical protein
MGGLKTQIRQYGEAIRGPALCTYNGAMDNQANQDEQEPVHPFSRLDPLMVLDALDSVGLYGDGRLLALNSYENRVYQVGCERAAGGGQVLPSGALERCRHPRRARFVDELAEREVPVVPALAIAGRTLHEFAASASPSSPAAAAARRSCRTRRRWNGSAASSGASTRSARSRPMQSGRRSTSTPSAASRATGCCATIHPARAAGGLASVVDQALDGVARCFDRAGTCRCCACTATATSATCCGPATARISSTSTTAAWVPAVQDLWMLLSGERQDMVRQMATCWPATRISASSIRASCTWSKPCAPAPDPLFGLAGDALGRSGLPGRLPVV